MQKTTAYRLLQQQLILHGEAAILKYLLMCILILSGPRDSVSDGDTLIMDGVTAATSGDTLVMVGDTLVTGVQDGHIPDTGGLVMDIGEVVTDIITTLIITEEEDLLHIMAEEIILPTEVITLIEITLLTEAIIQIETILLTEITPLTEATQTDKTAIQIIEENPL